MKRTLTKAIVIAFMLLAVISAAISASGMLAGTPINNNATVSYQDVNNNAKQSVTSNTVTTIVNMVCGVDVSEVATVTTENKTNDFPITITNTGNADDSFALQLTGVPAGWGQAIYRDTDGDGILDPKEKTKITSTGVLGPDQSYKIIVHIVAPSPPTIVNETINAILKATSEADSAVSDSSTIILTVQQAIISVVKSASNEEPMPLQPFDYVISVANSGPVPAYSIEIIDDLPSNIEFIGPVYFDEDGPGSKIPVELPAAYFEGTISAAIGSISGGTTATISFTVQVKEKVEADTSIGNTANVFYEDADGNSFSKSDTYSLNVANKPGVDIEKNYTKYVNPGDKLGVEFSIKNIGNSTDDFTLSADHSGTLDLIWTIYEDTDKDGIYETLVGETSQTDPSIGTTGSIVVDQTFNYIAKANIPASAADGGSNILQITTTSSHLQTPPASDQITITNTVMGPILTLTKSVDKSTANPGETLTYSIIVTNTGTGDAVEVIITDDIGAMVEYVDYVAGSTTVDGVVQTDSDDSDYSMFSTNAVTVKIPRIDGTLKSGTPKVSFKITFKVTVK